MAHKWIRVVGVVAAGVALSACSRTAPAPVAAPEPTSTTVSTTSADPTTSPGATTTSNLEAPHDLPDYGVLETSKRPVSAGETTCAPDTPPAQTVEAHSAAPGSPTVLLGLPDGFTPAADPQGDIALNLTGPDGMTGTVTITPTTLDAAAAFQAYGDDRTKGSEISSLSVLPGDLCGYSGQELMGMLADQPGQGIEFADRVVHVWTNDGNFLIAIRLQAPKGTSLDAAKSVLLADFGIRMPG